MDGFAVSVVGNIGRYDGDHLDPETVWQIHDFQPLLDEFVDGLTFCVATAPCT